MPAKLLSIQVNGGEVIARSKMQKQLFFGDFV